MWLIILLCVIFTYLGFVRLFRYKEGLKQPSIKKINTKIVKGIKSTVKSIKKGVINSKLCAKLKSALGTFYKVPC